MAQANDGGSEYVLVEGGELGQGSGQGEESVDAQGEDNTEQGPQHNSESQDNRRTEDQRIRSIIDPTILMLRDAIVEAIQQGTNPTVTLVTPILSIVTAMKKAIRKEFYQNKARKDKVGSQNSKGKEKEQASTRNENPFTGECYKCGKKGHRASDCKSKRTSNPMQGKKRGKCFSCQQLGHYAYECPMKNPIPAKTINTRPPQALLSNEPVPKRQALGERVYNLGLEENRAPGPAQGPNAGNTSI